MPCSFSKKFTTATADDDSVFADQQPGGSGSFTLDGVNVSNGVWSSPDGLARLVTFTHAGNDSGRTMTVTGYVDDAQNHAVTENVTGANATTVTTTKHYRYITSITINGAAAGNIKCGFDAADDCVYVVGMPYNERDISVAVNLTGTATFSIQHTTSPIHKRNAVGNALELAYGDWVWVTNSDINGSTATDESSYVSPVEGLRLLISSYTAGAVLELNVHSPVQ